MGTIYLEKVFNEVGAVADGELEHEDVLSPITNIYL
jgi:hypothetical protein